MRQNVIELRRSSSNCECECDSDSDVCRRGIEHFASKQILEELCRTKDSVVDAVLSEQESKSGPNSIALASESLSLVAKQRAYVMGLSDQASAQEELSLSCAPDHALFYTSPQSAPLIFIEDHTAISRRRRRVQTEPVGRRRRRLDILTQALDLSSEHQPHHAQDDTSHATY